MGAAVVAGGPANSHCGDGCGCGCGAAAGRCGCANKGCGAPSGGCGCARGAKAAPDSKADATHPQRPPRGTPHTAAWRDDGPRQARRPAQPEVQGDESAAGARRRAFIEQELPELWPTQESMDAAAALRALARRLSAQLEAHDKQPKPVQVPLDTLGPIRSDPDFDLGVSGDVSFVLTNPIWRFGTGTSCERLERGSEGPELLEEWRKVNRVDSACVGRVAISFDMVGEPMGGYQMNVTDGCQCSVSSTLVSGSSVDAREWDTSGVCYRSFADTIGMYDVPTT
jgi:hypothetical protein